MRVPTASAVGLPGPDHARPPVTWALIGNRTDLLQQERDAGINARVIRLSWKDYMPSPSAVDRAYAESKRRELAQTRSAGLRAIIDIGLQDVPPWIHHLRADSRYVNQYGDEYVAPSGSDGGDANLVFNATLRADAADYIRRVVGDLGGDIAAMRMGGGRWGELTYPPHDYAGRTNCYWVFDAAAAAESPAPGWKPGEPSPSGEAGAFAAWHLDSLARFQEWQVSAARRAGWRGPILMLYPSWGVRPGQLDAAVDQNLAGLTPAETNGELPRGYDFARLVSGIGDRDVAIVTTWLDADSSGDASSDPSRWSPARYLASLAAASPFHPAVFGENSGQGSAETLRRSVQQVRNLNLAGLLWYHEDELLSGEYATLGDFSQAIRGR